MQFPISAHGAAAQCTLPLKLSGENTGQQSAPRTFFSSIRDCCQRREGAQLVEFALVAPMFLVLIAGISVLGIGLNNYIVLTDAVSQGSRAFAASTGVNVAPVNGDPCAYAVLVMNTDAISLNTANITYTITYTPKGSSTPQQFTTNTCSTIFSGMEQGDVVTVQASYPAIMPKVGQNGIFVWAHMNAISWVAHTTQVVQ
jgi:hypothetical protein